MKTLLFDLFFILSYCLLMKYLEKIQDNELAIMTQLMGKPRKAHRFFAILVMALSFLYFLR